MHPKPAGNLGNLDSQVMLFTPNHRLTSSRVAQPALATRCNGRWIYRHGRGEDCTRTGAHTATLAHAACVPMTRARFELHAPTAVCRLGRPYSRTPARGAKRAAAHIQLPLRERSLVGVVGQSPVG